MYSRAGLAGFVAVAICFGMPTTGSTEEHYPDRTVRFVVPAPAGTVLDALPRIVAEALSARWRQPVIIENRPGFSQNLGAEAVAKADPDGYTLLAAPPGPLVVSQHLFSKLAFDPTAFAPITVLAKLPGILVANPGVAAAGLPDLLAYAKLNPGKLTYASPGVGSTPQLEMEELTRRAAIQIVHIPYQGMAPAQRDVVAGHVDIMINDIANALPLIRDGKLKPIAVTGAERLRELPQVPAISETFPSFVHGEWFALVAPPKTPADIVNQIHMAVSEALRSPQVLQKFQQFSATPDASSPEDTAKLLQQESDRWHKLIVTVGLKLN